MNCNRSWKILAKPQFEVLKLRDRETLEPLQPKACKTAGWQRLGLKLQQDYSVACCTVKQDGVLIQSWRLKSRANPTPFKVLVSSVLGPHSLEISWDDCRCQDTMPHCMPALLAGSQLSHLQAEASVPKCERHVYIIYLTSYLWIRI